MDAKNHFLLEKAEHTVHQYHLFNDISKDSVLNSRYPKKYGKWTQHNSFDVFSDEEIKQYYGDITKSFVSYYEKIVIDETKDKVSLKIYITNKKRAVGSKFFKIDRFTHYLTFNLRTKNIFVGTISRKNKKLINKICRVNTFNDGRIDNMIHLCKSIIAGPKQYGETINNNKVYEQVRDIFIKLFGVLESKTGLSIIDNLVDNYKFSFNVKEFYLKYNEVKLPDSLKRLYGIPVPKKVLTKEKNLVNAIMSHYKLRGKNVKTILNQNKTAVDFTKLLFLYETLGVDYFNKVDSKFYTDKGMVAMDFSMKMSPLNLTIQDKRKFVLALDFCKVNLIIEHFNIKKNLENKFNYIVKPKFTDRHSFDIEHHEWSGLLADFRKGKITRFYGKDAVPQLQEEIYSFDGSTYYPTVLLNSDDYNRESMVQSNCVRTYTEKPYCIIISLRFGNSHSEERATIEYQFRRNEILRVQSYGRFNKDLSSIWTPALEILDKRVSSLYKSKVLQIPEMIKQFPNGTEIKRKANFVDDMTLKSMMPVWDTEEDMGEVDIFDFF